MALNNPAHPRNSRTRAQRQEEARLYRWQLTQRLLADVDALRPDRRAQLDTVIPGWDYPLTYEDIDHALWVDDAELNDALTIWYNRRVKNLTALTLDQIRLLAATN